MYFRVMDPTKGTYEDYRTEAAAIAAYYEIDADEVPVFVVFESEPGVERWAPFDVTQWNPPTVLPDSGAISLGAINAEFKRGNDINTYRGAGWYKPNGQSGTFSSGTLGLDEFHGKQANSPETRVAITTNVTNLDLWSWAKTQGWDGTSKLQVTVNAGVWVYSDDTARPALSIVNSYPNGVVLVNNGNIIGRGGNGGAGNNGGSGGSAISLGTPITISNAGFIAGGGGGGGGSVKQQTQGDPAYNVGGGGGAGGGVGGAGTSGGGGSGGGVGGKGGDGTGPGGGGGGRILPGVGGAGAPEYYDETCIMFGPGYGGGAGGGGGQCTDFAGWPFDGASGGGGGGWGANGGQGWHARGNGTITPAYTFGIGGAGGGANNAGANGTGTTRGADVNMTSPGGAGGKAVALNGNAITWAAQGTIYGAVS